MLRWISCTAVRSSPSRVALLMGSEPLFGALVAALWLGEWLGVAGWAGGALIVVSAGWAGWPREGGRDGAVKKRVSAGC